MAIPPASDEFRFYMGPDGGRGCRRLLEYNRRPGSSTLQSVLHQIGERQFSPRSVPVRCLRQSFTCRRAESAKSINRIAVQQDSAGADLRADAAVLPKVRGDAELLLSRKRHPKLPANPFHAKQFE